MDALLSILTWVVVVVGVIWLVLVAWVGLYPVVLFAVTSTTLVLVPAVVIGFVYNGFDLFSKMDFSQPGWFWAYVAGWIYLIVVGKIGYPSRWDRK